MDPTSLGDLFTAIPPILLKSRSAMQTGTMGRRSQHLIVNFFWVPELNAKETRHRRSPGPDKTYRRIIRVSAMPGRRNDRFFAGYSECQFPRSAMDL